MLSTKRNQPVEKKIPAQKNIRYIRTDIDLKNDTVYAHADSHLQLDSLTVKYMGFRCEHEVMAFVAFP